MTRWLQAVRQAGSPADKTDRTDKTPPGPRPTGASAVQGNAAGPVLSVLSVLSEPGEPVHQPRTDPEAYARHLRDNGPSTYGAAAAELGWGATRAWQAEARLRAAGRIRFDHLGKAHLVEAAVHGPALASAADVNSNT